jgi:RsiW-degrading membrane proteinase PrsW (M82 family)
MRAVLGFVVGYAISLTSSVAYFQLLHRDPHAAAPYWFVAVTALFGVVFAVLAGFVAVKIAGPGRGQKTGTAVGIAILVVALLSAVIDVRGAHWSQIVAMVLMAPAAGFGGKLAAERRYARVKRT